MMHFQEKINDEDLRHNLDLIKERCERSNIRQVAYKNAVEGYYNSRVKDKAFKVRYYVLRKNKASHAQPWGKLGPKWDGPYKVTKAHRNGSYALKTIKGRLIPRTWNARNLKKLYF